LQTVQRRLTRVEMLDIAERGGSGVETSGITPDGDAGRGADGSGMGATCYHLSPA
jgi:hypothetical protein